MKREIYLGFGANLGDPLTTLQESVIVLNCKEIDVVKKSPLYKTAPVGGPSGQDEYINGVVQISTVLEPSKLLQQVHAIEQQFGRVRTVRWGARTLDIDILLYGPDTVEQPDLSIPHPRMHERRFVLQPLVDIAPELTHPATGIRFAEYLAICEDQEVKQIDAGW